MTDAKVAEAARRWVLARERAEKLRAKRAGLECLVERAERDAEMAACFANRPHVPGDARPCWKAWEDEIDGAGCHRRVRDGNRVWCEPCHEREIVNADYRRATASRGAAERVLLRYAKARVTP